MQNPPRSALLRYGGSIAAILLATAARLALDPLLGDRFPFATLFLAILAIAGYAGRGPALLATGLGAVASALVLLPPRGGLSVRGPEQRAGLLLFVVVGAGIAHLGGVLREARRRAEATADEAVRQREQSRITLDSIGEGVVVVDARGRVTSLNPVAEALTGWTSREAAGQPIPSVFRIVEEGGRREVESPALRALRDGVTVGLANHTLLIARDGTERPIDDGASPIRDESGRVAGAVLIFRDATEQRRADEARRRLAAIVESSDDAIVGKDLEGIITSWNAAAERLYGYPAAEAIGRPFSILVPPERAGEVEDFARRLRAGERLDHFETVRRRKDGRLVDVSVGYSPVLDGEGRPIGTAVISRDISGRRRAEGRRNARLAVTQILAQSTDLSDAAPGLLQAVCEGLGWSVGVLWAADRPSGPLRCVAAWHPPGLAEGFAEATRRATFGPGDGVPGRTWAGGESIWLADVAEDERFARRRVAAEEGLHGGFACPVSGDGEVLGVVEFFSREIREPDADLLEMMATLGGQLGQALVRWRAEERLRRSERELADFFENATVGLHWVGPDGTILRANQAELDLLGYDREEYVGRNIAEFHADEDVICDILRRLQGGETLRDYPARLRCKDGRIKDVLIDSSVMQRDGQFVHTRCFTRDVSGRVRTELQLREQTRIAEALNRIGVLLAAELDLERLVQVVTDEATRLTDARFGAFFYNVPDQEGGSYTLYTISGVPRAAFSRFPMPRATELFGPTFRGEGVVRLDDVTQDPRFGRNDPHRGMPEGHLPVRSYLAVPVVSRSGDVLGGLFFGHPEPGVFAEPDERLVVGIAAQAAVALDNARLYRELRAAKDEAEAANRAKTQFLAVLSHELRTPLNPILLATSSMLDRPAEPDQFRPTLEMIRQNVNLQARLIDDLLDVTRIVRGKMPLQWEIADCHRIVDQAIQICRSDILGGGLRLEQDLAATFRHVNADPARLQQVFWNLIKNAVKFTPKGGTIAVRTRDERGAGESGGLIVIEVSDTGIGIEPDVLPRVFDPFQQGETTITRKFGGLGLGLAICKGVTDAHGGTIAVESGGKGRGTTFRVVLKGLPETAVGGDGEPDGGEPDGQRADPSSLRILVVEDEPATLRLMARLFRGLGHSVATADAVAPALEAFRAGEFDLIVSDIGLPDGTGLDLMRQVAAQAGPIPAIALTGFGMEEDIARSREAGFTAHMTKPIDFTRLEAMVRRVADRSHPNAP